MNKIFAIMFILHKTLPINFNPIMSILTEKSLPNETIKLLMKSLSNETVCY